MSEKLTRLVEFANRLSPEVWDLVENKIDKEERTHVVEISDIDGAYQLELLDYDWLEKEKKLIDSGLSMDDSLLIYVGSYEIEIMLSEDTVGKTNLYNEFYSEIAYVLFELIKAHVDNL